MTEHAGIRSNRLSALGDARFLAALFVLIVNDAVLKGAYGNWITGKLSDVAGLIVLPVIVAVVMGLRGADRRAVGRFAALAIGAWFALMKTWAPAAAGTEWLYAFLTRSPSQIIVDPTDLLGLLALPFAINIVANPKPVVLSRHARLGLLTLGAFASLATSPIDEPTGDLYVSDNGSVRVPYTEAEYLESDAVGRDEFVTEACVDPDGLTGCYRLVGDTIEMQLSDGTWTTDWRIGSDSVLTRTLLPRESAVEPVDILVDEFGTIHVGFEGIRPISKKLGGEWSRSFSYYRPVFGSIALLSGLLIGIGAAVASRARFALSISAAMMVLPTWIFFASLGAGDAYGPALPPTLVVAALTVPTVLFGLSVLAAAQVTHDRAALVFAGTGWAVAVALLMIWKMWMAAPPWLPIAAFVVVVAALVGIGYQRVTMVARHPPPPADQATITTF